MKRHFSMLVSVIAMIAIVFTLASCDGLVPDANKADAHQHTYTDAWSSDATNHWHAAACTEADCATVTAAKAAHVDADKNKICDVCAYDMGHEHAYAAEWATDADNHWHAASCGHNAVSGKAAHELDAAGVCIVCDYETGAIDVAKAVQLGASFKDLVNGGDVLYTYASYAGGDYSSAESEYKFGDNLVYIYDGNSEYAYWYSIDENDFFFPVMEYVDWSGADVSAIDENADKTLVMDGYAFASVFGYDGETYYGVENLVSALYELASANTFGASSEYVVVIEGVTTYTFSFAYPVYNEVYDEELGDFVYTDEITSIYEVQVAFTLTDNYSISSVVVDSTKYAVLDYDEDYNLVDSGVVVFEYDEDDNTKIVGYEIVKFSSAASYSYVVVQNEGERTLENKYDADAMLVSSFDLEYEDTTAVGETINMVAGTPLYLYFANVVPETADMGLETITVSSESQDVYGFYSTYSEYVYISINKGGTYEVTVSTTKASKTYNVNVVIPETTSITPVINSEQVTTYNCYADATGGITVTFGAVANEYADATYTAMLPVNAVNATLTNNDDGTYTFVSTATGTWEVLLTSSANPDVTNVLTINVNTPPAISDVLNGEYAANMNDFWTTNEVNVVFTPSAEGATDGTLVIEYYFSGFDYSVYENVEITATETMTYSYADGAITVTSVSVEGAEESLGFTFALNAMYEVTVTGQQFYDVAMTAVVDTGLEGSGTESDPYIITIPGDFTCAFPGGYNPVVYAFTATASGTVTVSSTYANAWLVGGADVMSAMNNNNNEGSGESVSFAVAANSKYYICVGDWNEAQMDVPFSVAFEAGEVEADGSSDSPYALEESNTCAFPGGYNWVYYTYTAESAGTLTITVTSSDYYWGFGSGAYAMENVGNETPSKDITLEAGETLWIGMSTDSGEVGTVTFTSSFVAAE